MKSIRFSSIVVFMIGLLAAGCLLAWTQAAPIKADSQEDTFTYLPIIVKPEAPQTTIVKLVSPANGAQLDTLVPVLVFETDAVPDNTGGCLTFSINPDPTGCNSFFGLYSDMYRERAVWFNLQPNTTYYWRVGAILNYNMSTIEWSQQRTFVTGPAGGVILPGPIPAAPADNSLVDPSTVVLQWNSVAGALEYDLTVHDKDENDWYGITGIPGSETQIAADRLQWIFANANGTHFEWYVTARNDYAWGEDGPAWNFSIPAGQNIGGNLPTNSASRFNGRGELVITKSWTLQDAK